MVLASLAHTERHGYGVAQDVEQLSKGRVRLTAGTLYGVLNRLCADGLVAFSREEVVGRPAPALLPADSRRREGPGRGDGPAALDGGRSCRPARGDLPDARVRHERAAAGAVRACLPARSARGRRGGSARPGDGSGRRLRSGRTPPGTVAAVRGTGRAAARTARSKCLGCRRCRSGDDVGGPGRRPRVGPSRSEVELYSCGHDRAAAACTAAADRVADLRRADWTCDRLASSGEVSWRCTTW